MGDLASADVLWSGLDEQCYDTVSWPGGPSGPTLWTWKLVLVMADRRPMGALEGDVLDVLWRADGPVTPADVRVALDTDLAYTTVMTILSRLWQKGLAARTKQGRAFAYEAVVSESDLAASRMRDALAGTSDRTATMSRFVDGLDKREAAALRALLDEAGG